MLLVDHPRENRLEGLVENVERVGPNGLWLQRCRTCALNALPAECRCAVRDSFSVNVSEAFRRWREVNCLPSVCLTTTAGRPFWVPGSMPWGNAADPATPGFGVMSRARQRRVNDPPSRTRSKVSIKAVK